MPDTDALPPPSREKPKIGGGLIVFAIYLFVATFFYPIVITLHVISGLVDNPAWIIVAIIQFTGWVLLIWLAVLFIKRRRKIILVGQVCFGYLAFMNFGFNVSLASLEDADHFFNTFKYHHWMTLYNSMIDYLKYDCGPGGL